MSELTNGILSMKKSPEYRRKYILEMIIVLLLSSISAISAHFYTVGKVEARLSHIENEMADVMPSEQVKTSLYTHTKQLDKLETKMDEVQALVYQLIGKIDGFIKNK